MQKGHRPWPTEEHSPEAIPHHARLPWRADDVVGLGHELGHAYHAEVLWRAGSTPINLPASLAESASLVAESLVRPVAAGSSPLSVLDTRLPSTRLRRLHTVPCSVHRLPTAVGRAARGHPALHGRGAGSHPPWSRSDPARGLRTDPPAAGYRRLCLRGPCQCLIRWVEILCERTWSQTPATTPSQASRFGPRAGALMRAPWMRRSTRMAWPSNGASSSSICASVPRGSPVKA